MLTLRPLRAEDVPALYEMYLQYPAMVNQSKVYGIDWLYRVVEDVDQYRYAVSEAEELVGIATLWWANRANGIISPTIWIERERQGLGMGWAVLCHLSAILQTSIPTARKLSAVAYGYNERSLGLCNRFFGPAEAVIPNQVFYQGSYYAELYYGKYRI